jgi:uncharacterized protein
MTTTRTTSKGRARRTPQRTCVGCRRTGDQSSFVRLVRVSAEDGARVEVDESSRRTAGRGAYLCPDQACWERGLKGPLAASLRTAISAPNRERLGEYAGRFATESRDTPPASADAGDEEGENS